MSPGGDAKASRRDFIRVLSLWIGSLIGAAVGGPALFYLFSPSIGKAKDTGWIDLGTLDDIAIGSPALREFTLTSVNGWERTAKSYGVFVLRQDAAHVRAFSNVCTHLGCHVNWHPDSQHYISPCHDGHFDILGRNISGPPPRPLDEFRSRIEGGRLYIDVPAFRRAG